MQVRLTNDKQSRSSRGKKSVVSGKSCRTSEAKIPEWDVGAVYTYKNLGLKVFMDAHQPVTLKEGDRYPLGPPYKNTLHAHPSWLTAGSGASNQASHSVFLYDSFI